MKSKNTPAISPAAAKRKFIIIVSICVLIWIAATIFLIIVFAKGWGRECYQRGVDDGYKLRQAEELFLKQKPLNRG